MAKKRFFVDIDLSKNQLLKAVIENGSDAGMATLLTVAGQVAYNTDNNQLNYFDGSAVQHLIAGTEDFAGNIANDTYSASVKAVYDYYRNTASGGTVGASVIGISDDGGYFTADQVEGALQEIGKVLNDISAAIHLQGTIAADNSTHNYPTTPDGSGDGGAIQEGDAFLVTGTIDATGTTAGTFINLGPTSVWVGAGSLIIAAVNGATNSDTDWYVLDARRQPSSTTVRGLIALATQDEVNAGTDNTKAVTSLTLKAFVENVSGTTMYVETVSSGGTSATVNHNLGSDVVVQVWLDGDEDITSGIALTSGAGIASYASNTSMPGTLKFVCVGKTSAYWASL